MALSFAARNFPRRRSTVNSTTKKRPDGQAGYPEELKGLRACMICSLVKTQIQFEEEGCDNCEEKLNLAGRTGSAYLYTSTNFEGMISMMDSMTSWVAKWQHIDNLKMGVYAVSVQGELPSSLKQELIESGFRYRCRDKGLTPEELAEREREQDGEDVVEDRERRLRKSRRQRRKKKQEKRRASRVSESSGVGEFQESNEGEGLDGGQEDSQDSGPGEGDKSGASADEEDANANQSAASVRILSVKDEVMSVIGPY